MSTLSENEENTIRLWQEIWALRHKIRGPEGFPTWKAAAIAEKVKKNGCIRDLSEEVNKLNTQNTELREALKSILDVYIEYSDGVPYQIREIKIGYNLFNRAYDAFEHARKLLVKESIK